MRNPPANLGVFLTVAMLAGGSHYATPCQGHLILSEANQLDELGPFQGEIFAALGKIGEPLMPQECHASVAQRGQDLWRGLGAHPAAVLLEGGIAHIMKTVLYSPVLA